MKAGDKVKIINAYCPYAGCEATVKSATSSKVVLEFLDASGQEVKGYTLNTNEVSDDLEAEVIPVGNAPSIPTPEPESPQA